MALKNKLLQSNHAATKSLYIRNFFNTFNQIRRYVIMICTLTKNLQLKKECTHD